MLLALDTATPATVLAVGPLGGPMRAGRSLAGAGKHEETLLPALAELLDAAALPKTALRVVAAGRGPGGFTSLRVGLATAKGLAVGLRLEAVGVDTLRALARSADAAPGSAVLALLDAKRGEAFGALAAVRPTAHAPTEGTRLLLPAGSGRAVDWLARALEALPAGTPLHVVGEGAAAAGEPLREAVARARDAGWDVRLDEALRTPTPEGLFAEANEAHARGERGREGLLPCYARPLDAVLPAVPLRTDV